MKTNAPKAIKPISFRRLCDLSRKMYKLEEELKQAVLHAQKIKEQFELAEQKYDDANKRFKIFNP